MSLRKLKNPVPEKLVQVSDTESFPVRGLSPSGVVGLYYRHTGQLSDIFERIMGGYQENGVVATSDVQAIAMSLVEQSPQIMAEIIALASGSNPADETLASDADGNPIMSDAGDRLLTCWEADVAVALQLSFPVQADALEKIGAVTFTSEMPLGKFVALVARAIKAATPSKLSGPVT